MAYFMTRDDGRQPVGGRNVGRPPPAPDLYGGGNQNSPGNNNPASPLSRFVQEGYQPQPGGMLGAPGGGQQSGGFDAGVAQQWTNNVQSIAHHQQQHDPNFVPKVKSNGYRVSQAPGGGSSLSLAWGGDGGAAPDNGAGQGSRAAYRAPSPGAFGARGRSSSRDQIGGGDMAGIMGGGPQQQSNPSSRGSNRAPSPGVARASHMMGTAAYDSRAAPTYGGAQYGGNYGPPGGVQHGMPPQMPSGGGRQGEATSLTFGARAEGGSSNAYANGANQNCGNGITDRRTTKVLEPPGGRSQISFG